MTRSIRAARPIVPLGLALLLGVLLLAPACGPEAPDFPHPQTLEEAMAVATARGVPILIDFYSPG